MAEAVRLVIWDLDETFWKGTLTEGGMTYQTANHEIVMELARRGIMSSICSKNDMATVRAVLQEHGIWDTFIFPSIDWTSKGPRIRDLIEAVQLRPASILFIDDNPQNLNEAKHFSPDLQIADETFIPAMLADPRFKGKDDSGLTRLAQYKLLEQRAADQAGMGGDNLAFLRASNIRVIIEHAIEPQLERAVELINRTNQLNFTKKRLSEEPAIAATELRAFIAGWRMQVGLVRVVDNYGDYGYCGFYAFDKNKMHHFCFSCRILGMGVEQWLYARLGKPPLNVVGEVLSDLNTPEVDWIRLADSAADAEGPAVDNKLGTVMLRGGCDLTAVGHYLSLVSREVIGEYNLVNANLDLRLDHSIFLRYAVDGLSGPARAALAKVGYEMDKFDSRFREVVDSTDVFIFSFWTDAGFALYTHKETGVQVPFQIGAPVNFRTTDLTRLPAAEHEKLMSRPANVRAMTALCEEFEFSGPISKAKYHENIEAALRLIGPDKPVILTLAWEGHRPGDVRKHQELNEWTREIAARHRNILLLDITGAIEAKSDVTDPTHFDRKVYQRLAKQVTAMIEAASLVAEPV
jgi:FkbH-like protein